MIGSIRGTVTHVGQDHALVEVGGIGYRVVAGPALLAKLRVGSEASVFTHHLVREDLQALFGFATTEELAFFELLMTVSQVGPRLALAITAAHPVTRLQLAIVTDDVDVYTSVSGVGRKTAQRIILELKEKVHAAGIAVGPGGGIRLGRRRGARVPRLHRHRGPSSRRRGRGDRWSARHPDQGGPPGAGQVAIGRRWKTIATNGGPTRRSPSRSFARSASGRSSGARPDRGVRRTACPGTS